VGEAKEARIDVRKEYYPKQSIKSRPTLECASNKERTYQDECSRQGRKTVETKCCLRQARAGRLDSRVSLFRDSLTCARAPISKLIKLFWPGLYAYCCYKMHRYVFL
jgi:hypothetical protein